MWRRQGPGLQARPVHPHEPQVASRHGQARPLRRRQATQLPDKFDCRGRHVGGKGHGLHALEDVCVHLLFIARTFVEGRSSSQKVVHENAYRPSVCPIIVTLIGDNLWGQVHWRAAEGPALLAGLQPLGNAKVGQLHVAGRVEQQVLRLEVPVDDPLRVQVVQSFNETVSIRIT